MSSKAAFLQLKLEAQRVIEDCIEDGSFVDSVNGQKHAVFGNTISSLQKYIFDNMDDSNTVYDYYNFDKLKNIILSCQYIKESNMLSDIVDIIVTFVGIIDWSNVYKSKNITIIDSTKKAKKIGKDNDDANKEEKKEENKQSKENEEKNEDISYAIMVNEKASDDNGYRYNTVYFNNWINIESNNNNNNNNNKSSKNVFKYVFKICDCDAQDYVIYIGFLTPEYNSIALEKGKSKKQSIYDMNSSKDNNDDSKIEDESEYIVNNLLTDGNIENVIGREQNGNSINWKCGINGNNSQFECNQQYTYNPSDTSDIRWEKLIKMENLYSNKNDKYKINILNKENNKSFTKGSYIMLELDFNNNIMSVLCKELDRYYQQYSIPQSLLVKINKSKQIKVAVAFGTQSVSTITAGLVAI